MKKFQVVEIKGDYQAVGSAIGEAFRETIQNQIEKRKSEIPDYDKYLVQSKKYFEYTKQIFPNLIIEVEAIASSAQVDVMDYFFINNREVYDPAEEDHCTIAVSFGKDGAIIGHNEDWSIEATDDLYILKASIGEVTFTGLNYKTAIAGVSASMNNFGLVQCINDLYQTNQFGVPKNFFARAVLECKALDEAENLIRNTKRASGFNHVLVQGQEVRNIEIAGNQLAVEKLVSTPYIHTNHYVSPELKSLEKFHTASSEARYTRAEQLVKNGMSVDDMENLLRDTQNKTHPICRADATIGSVVIIPAKNEFWTCYGHPCIGGFLNIN